MCCFSRHVEKVWSTRIFARPLEDGRQLLVYGMSLDVSEDVAMILPIPVPPGSADDAVRFVDMSACPTFFDDIARLFPQAGGAPKAFGMQSRSAAATPPLVVHDVGDFEASFVPTPRDFDRLDERFRLPSEVWEQLPRYADWGFCVFKLKKTGGGRGGLLGLFKSSKTGAPRTVHPMAFEFPRRDPAALFFPTVHVHDGQVHPTAEFDHELFCQTEPAWEPLMIWGRSEWRTDRLAAGALPWVQPSSWMYKTTMRGEHPNRDTYLAESKLRARTATCDVFRLRMQAAWEHVIDDGKTEFDLRVKKWMRVSEAERARIRDAVVAQLSTLFAEKIEEWRLAPFAHDLPQVYPAAYEAMGPVLIPPVVEGRGCYAAFFASNDRIEPQQLNVAFAAIPGKEIGERIQEAFQVAIDRATR